MGVCQVPPKSYIFSYTYFSPRPQEIYPSVALQARHPLTMSWNERDLIVCGYGISSKHVRALGT